MKTIEEKKHAKYSASGAHRWLNCPGSVKLSEKAPPQKSSAYAEEGTLAHSLLEAFLKSKNPRTTRSQFLDKHDPEMVNHAFSAFKEIAENRQREGMTLLCETKVDLSFIAPDMFGTVDAALVEEFGRLTVFDFKYGAGVPVEAEGNEQLLYYALGIAHQYDYNFSEIAIVIIQPRAEHPDGPVREWVIHPDNLQVFADTLRTGIATCEMDEAPLSAGDHCRWCPAAPICPEVSSKALKAAQVEFAADPITDAPVIQAPDLTTLTPESAGRMLSAFEQLEFWVSQARTAIFNMMERGENVPGFKLVQKRSTRKWTDPAAVAKAAKKKFGDKAFVTELLSPAQLEKVAGSEWVNERASSVSSGLTIAPESDKRPAVNAIMQDFTDVPEEVKTVKQSRKGKSNGRKK